MKYLAPADQLCIRTPFTGAYCTACKCTESDGIDPECIKAGFPMDRNVPDLNRLFERLDALGLLKKKSHKKKDYGVATGLTQPPKFKEKEITWVCNFTKIK